MSATPKYQPTGLLTDKGLSSLYNKTFDDIRQVTDSVPREGAQFFAQESTNLETMKIGEVLPILDVPPENEDTDEIPLANPLEGYNTTITVVRRRQKVQVTRSAITRQKTRMLSALLNGLPNSAKRIEELAYAYVWNGGFDTITTGDGSYLFATDHYYEDPRQGQYANKAASGSGFTTAAYFSAWLNLQQRNNARGFPEPQVPTAVYYPVALEEDISKVHNSAKYPQNSLNAEMDKLFSMFNPVRGYWLTDDSAWFVVGNNDEAGRGLIIVWEEKPSYAPLSESNNPDIIMGKRLLISFGVGALHGRNLYGNAGA